MPPAALPVHANVAFLRIAQFDTRPERRFDDDWIRILAFLARRPQ